MNFGLLLREFIKSLPAIIGMLIQLKKIWDQYIDASERSKKMQEFRDALKEAHDKKDTSRLESFIRDIVK